MKNQYSVSDLVRKMSVLVPNWRYVSNVLNVRAQDWPSDIMPVLNFHRQVVKVTHYLPESEQDGAIVNLEQLKDLPIDVAVSANVLNTLKNVQEGIDELAKINFNCLVVQIHPGTGSKRTTGNKKTGYQRNEPVESYVRLLQQNFHMYDMTLHRADNCIVLTKGRKFYAMDDLED
ncbi:hypothetical protein [Vibrio fluvialis]|uniref:hypothetical protein n=2 Tax=Vibrio fluvialis TaxID=676 RepID=UPI001EEA9390|nr:hypothetical protein [Vibrio fluvialis]MCG6387510.1 hypothetical protein [Vibrio fluvialis]